MLKILNKETLKGKTISRLVFEFSNVSKDRKKIQTIGFSNSNIENIKNLSYKLKNPILFTNGKYLIYRSKSSYLRVFKSYFLYVSAIAYLLYLLYISKHFDTFPISKHMYIGGIAVITFLMTRKFLHHQNIVKEINLLEGGKATEIIFQNQLKRQIFGQLTSKTLYNSIFMSPKESQEQFTYLNSFPKDLNKVQDSMQISNYWKKYYSNYQNYLLIPISYEHMNKQILGEVMNGKIIIF